MIDYNFKSMVRFFQQNAIIISNSTAYNSVDPTLLHITVFRGRPRS